MLSAHQGATTVLPTSVISLNSSAPGFWPSLIANPSSPEPRTKLFLAVRLLPALLFGPPFPLLRLMPSAHVLLKREFWTVPAVPSAQTPAPSCATQTASMSQSLPLMLIPPPLPPPGPLETALPSM